MLRLFLLCQVIFYGEKSKHFANQLTGKISIVINSGKHEKLALDMLSDVASRTQIVASGANKENIFPRLEIAVPDARSDMKMLVDMVCYFGITVRASIYNESLVRYCFLGPKNKLVSIDELPLKVGLEIDWVYTGNFFVRRDLCTPGSNI